MGMQTNGTNGKSWAQTYPELGTGPVPIEPCISPEYHALERERIFKQVWLNVGRVEEIPKAGDYLVKNIAAGEASVLIVRGRDGTIRAFHNMCSHRGNKVVWDGDGTCRGVFACKFHGWSYNTEGRLIFVPDEDQFFDLDKTAHGLTPVAADTWEGFIFINLAPQPRETLTEYLGELGEQLHGFPFDRYTTRYTYQTEAKVSWKVAADAFQEGYHVAFIHARSLPSYGPKENPLVHLPWVQLYRNHRRFSVDGNPTPKPTPIQTLVHKLGRSFDTMLSASTDDLPPYLNPGKVPNWSFDINVIFPNFFVDVLDGMYFTYNFWPLAVDRTLWEFRQYFPPATSVEQRFAQEYSKCLFRDALLEDLSTLEETQQALATRAKTHFLLQDNEVCIRHGHKVVEDHVGFYSGGGA